MVRRVAVVGAGVIGLSTALSLQQSDPTMKVTLISEAFDQGTTSWGAGGFFRLDIDSYPEDEREKARQWGTDSWHHFNSLARSEQATESGMKYINATLLFGNERDASYKTLSELTYDFVKLDERQIEKTNIPGPFKAGYCFTTVITHTPTYLKWLQQRFRECGGSVLCQKVSSLSELSGAFDLVVNCCGIGAMELCQDKAMYPIMGHLIKVKAPWIKKAFFSDKLYVFPHDDYVILGGIREKNSWDLSSSPANRKTILDRAYALFPHLKNAPILDEWVGLRPARKYMRLEPELLNCGDKKLQVVHNYGHGGHGITLSWGCALEATRIVKDLLGGGPVGAKL